MAPERRRKACKECRQQKIKCDGEPPEICSRCRRMGLSCVLSSNSTARQTKAQLQKELEMLKGDDGDLNTPTRRDSAPHVPAASVTGRQQSASEPEFPILLTPAIAFSISPSASNEVSTAATEDERCISRSLDGLHIDARKIRDCFAQFFCHYSPLLPILDPMLNPNDYYDMSPFLFWAVVFVGCRRYSTDPTLLGNLGSRINSMALQSLESRSTPIQTIQGLLILCVWPIPLNTMHKDISSVLSGAALHLAMQIGLHVIGSAQDFSRTKLASGHAQKVFRAQLWVHCWMVCHSTSLREGLPPLMMANTINLGLDNEELLSEFPEELRIRKTLHTIMMSSSVAMMKSLQDPASTSQSNALSPFISLFDSQLLELLRRCHSGISTLHVTCCRLHLLSMYFFERSDTPNRVGLVRLYSVACSAVENLMAEDQESGLGGTCPVFIERCIMLAVVAILKICRSPLSEHVDLEAGERAYFTSILFFRRASLQNDDLPARAATIMTQLWTSKNIFRQPDGTVESLGTRIRSRSAMGVVFDCFWWWKEEYAGEPSPYRGNTGNIPSRAPSIPMTPGILMNSGPQLPSQGGQFPASDAINGMVMFAEDPFPDYDWAANFDFADFNWTNTENVMGQ